MKLKTENIFQITEIPTSRNAVYEALTDAKVFFSITGLHAEFHSEAGTYFQSENKKVSGYYLSLEPNEYIVMAWRHEYFHRGIHTIVHIELTDMDNGGTRIHFNHIGVPEEHAGWLTEHWRKDVLNLLLAHFKTLDK
jgi:uncharacterized protein YndB with AHSA1/START domain